MADRTMLAIKVDPLDQIGVGKNDGVGLFGSLAPQGRIERCTGSPKFQPAWFRVRVRRDQAALKKQVSADSPYKDGRDYARYEASNHFVFLSDFCGDPQLRSSVMRLRRY